MTMIIAQHEQRSTPPKCVIPPSPIWRGQRLPEDDDPDFYKRHAKTQEDLRWRTSIFDSFSNPAVREAVRLAVGQADDTHETERREAGLAGGQHDPGQFDGGNRLLLNLFGLDHQPGRKDLYPNDPTGPDAQAFSKDLFWSASEDLEPNLKRQIRNRYSNAIKKDVDNGEKWGEKALLEIKAAREANPLLKWAGLKLDADDDMIRAGARQLVEIFSKMPDRDFALKSASQIIKKEVPGQHREAQLDRICDEQFWRSRIRKILRPVREEIPRRLVPKAVRWCSDDGAREREQMDQNRLRFSENHSATSDDGCEIDLPSPGVSAANYYAETLTRCKGIEDLAAKRGYDQEVMVTVTLPSEFHPMSTNAAGARYENPNFDPSLTVRAGQAWLMNRWARFRAKMGRREIETFFFRSAQPHLDGTPHWHISMYLPKDKMDLVEHHIRLLFQTGKEEHQVDFARKKKGDGVAYVSRHLRYVCRHLKSSHNDSDETKDEKEQDSEKIKKQKEEEAEALRATQWACSHGIRRIAFSHSAVGDWRILRKKEFQDLAEHIPQIQKAAEAADQGRFADFLLAKQEAQIRSLYLDKENRFNEIVPKLGGLKVGSLQIPFLKTWTISKKKDKGRTNTKTDNSVTIEDIDLSSGDGVTGEVGLSLNEMLVAWHDQETIQKIRNEEHRLKIEAWASNVISGNFRANLCTNCKDTEGQNQDHSTVTVQVPSIPAIAGIEIKTQPEPMTGSDPGGTNDPPKDPHDNQQVA